MKRSGRILLCLACGMALSAVAQAANGPTPASPPTTPTTASTNPSVARLNAQLKKKIEEFKKRNHGRSPYDIPMPGGPAASTPAQSTPGQNVAQPNPAAPQSVSADTVQGNPYGSIVTRNVFGLNPPPPPGPAPEPGAPPPKITLTGITTIFGPAEALYKVSGVPQPGKPPKDESYILKEGEQQDEVAVEHIDVAKGIVTFKNHGETQDIPLAAGVASSSAVATGGGGGFQPPRAGGFGRMPTIYNYNNLPANVRARLQQRFGNGAFNQNGNNNNPSGQAGFNGSYNGYNNGNNPNSSSTTPQLSPEDSAALIAAQHAQLEQQGDPKATLFPPTQFDDQARQEAGRGNSPGVP